METPRRPVVLHEGEGRRVSTRVVKADGALTEGQLLLTLVTSQPNVAGPPAHVHQRNDEAFYILEGDFTFQVDDRTSSVGPGDFVYVPAGSAHAFVNLGETPGRMLEIFTPADFEGYFEELATMKAAGSSPEHVAALQAKYGMEVVGPPLESTDA